ncbi:hypothetical protein FHX42_004541 [Saccharopolyspora lacisalsi]|uniref:Uncharacterized protein n=1 Tax=Halosaccharopolyspora lacisalsi TaxID=1000566 RepID=A0A839E607_9PSEU|nr:hypothetical protein [Halosaccharopolyspora lacisalsi]
MLLVPPGLLAVLLALLLALLPGILWRRHTSNSRKPPAHVSTQPRSPLPHGYIVRTDNHRRQPREPLK